MSFKLPVLRQKKESPFLQEVNNIKAGQITSVTKPINESKILDAIATMKKFDFQSDNFSNNLLRLGLKYQHNKVNNNKIAISTKNVKTASFVFIHTLTMAPDDLFETLMIFLMCFNIPKDFIVTIKNRNFFYCLKRLQESNSYLIHTFLKSELIIVQDDI